MGKFEILPRSQYPDWPETCAGIRYDWDMSGHNTEWREVAQSVAEILGRKFPVRFADTPEFVPGEDLVDLTLDVAGDSVVLSNDSTLSLIWINVTNKPLLIEIEKLLIDAVGMEQVPKSGSPEVSS